MNLNKCICFTQVLDQICLFHLSKTHPYLNLDSPFGTPKSAVSSEISLYSSAHRAQNRSESDNQTSQKAIQSHSRYACSEKSCNGVTRGLACERGIGRFKTI